jgi:hypothetical protein
MKKKLHSSALLFLWPESCAQHPNLKDILEAHVNRIDADHFIIMNIFKLNKFHNKAIL